MNTLLYQVDDRPPLPTTVLLAAQHMLAALGGIIAVPLVIGAVLKLPADQVVALVNASLMGSGVITISKGAPDYADPRNLGIALFVLATVVAVVQFGKGIFSAAAVVIGVASRHVVALTGAFLLLAGLFPVLGAVLVTIPQVVLGGACLMMFAMILAAGAQMLASVEHSKRNGLVIAVSLGCGLAVSARPELLARMPDIVHEIFGSGISTGAIVASVLNLVLPGRPADAPDAEHDPAATPQPVLVKKAGAA